MLHSMAWHRERRHGLGAERLEGWQCGLGGSARELEMWALGWLQLLGDDGRSSLLGENILEKRRESLGDRGRTASPGRAWVENW